MAGTQQPPRNTGRPGAMTAAMQAVQTVSGPKILRIGVTQAGMIDERVIRDRVTVTIGTTERNTFTVGAEGLPPTFELFQMAGGSYKLNFTDAMDGRITTPQGVKSFRELKEGRLATKSNIGWQIPLTDESRGKISIGDTTVLFQFVTPPPRQPRPQLPSAIRAGWVKNIDWTYNACLAGFMVLAFSGIAYVEYLYDPEIDDTFAVDPRVVTLATRPPVEEPPPEAPHANDHPDQAAEQHPAEQQRPQHHEDPHPAPEQQHEREVQRATAQADAAANRAQRAADAAMAALNSAQFQALTAVGQGAGSATDRLQSGGLMNGSVAALANTGGVSNRGGGSGLSRGGMAASAGGVGGNSLGGGHAVAGAGDSVGSGDTVVVERRIVGNASLGSSDVTGGEGSLDGSAIERGLRGASGGLRSCYERSLRNNPDLHGRVDITFTIGATGRVTSVSTRGLDTAPEVGTCIQSTIRRIVFPAPTGGSVEGSTSVNFSPGG